MNLVLRYRLLAPLLLAICSWDSAAERAKVTYPDAVRISQYITARDGTRLAIDIHRPAVGEVPIDKPLPVLLMATIDYRVDLEGGRAVLSPSLRKILSHGYVIASLETRGQGASFGRTAPGRIETAQEYWDMYDVIEWLAAQSWSSGGVGMVGCSNRGMLQLRAAAVMPPHLVAIAPTSAPIDWAVMGDVNGVTAHTLDGSSKPSIPPVPVDHDREAKLLNAAVMEHSSWGNTEINRPFRDAPISLPGVSALPTSWWNLLPNFTISKTPVFQYAGWRDFFPEQAFALYRNLARLGVPQKLIIGPWYHCEWNQSSVTDAAEETRRWYDHWLKGIDDGLMKEPSIRYYVVGAPVGHEWREADKWPLPGTVRKTYYLSDHGRLQARRSDKEGSHASYIVNYSTSTTGHLATRWNLGNVRAETGAPGLEPILMSDPDTGSVLYTSAPLTADAELTGFPVVTLWISSTADDQDFFVYLEEVAPNGKSMLLTDGAVRASNRVTRDPPFDNEGLPWLPGYRGDQKKLSPGVPTKLEWALFPLSNYIKKGHRLRVRINSFDKGVWLSPEQSPAPTVTIFHDKQRASSISLPFVPTSEK